MAIDQAVLGEFIGKFVTDLGATVAAGNVVVGHRLGLYAALAAGPATAQELAERTQTDPRYVEEWLRGQAAGGYVRYDADGETYSMSEEQAFVLANPMGPSTRPARSSSLSAHCAPRTGLRNASVPARDWAGTNTTTTCSSAASSSSGRGTSQTSSLPGSRPWTASKPN
jgi:hypothetical protein